MHVFNCGRCENCLAFFEERKQRPVMAISVFSIVITCILVFNALFVYKNLTVRDCLDTGVNGVIFLIILLQNMWMLCDEIDKLQKPITFWFLWFCFFIKICIITVDFHFEHVRVIPMEIIALGFTIGNKLLMADYIKYSEACTKAKKAKRKSLRRLSSTPSLIAFSLPDASKVNSCREGNSPNSTDCGEGSTSGYENDDSGT